jgi:hypothetical protein
MVTAQISTRTAPPQVGKPWRKGQSGNPGGRPRIAADVKAEARKHTQEALDRLVYWMRSQDPQASIRAAMALLDRGCGKPEQAVAKWDGGESTGRPLILEINPFRGHRELMAEREGRAASPGATSALPS